MLSCYIVDDESHSIEILVDYIKDTPWLNLAGSNTNPVEGLEEFLALDPVPDILLLDINMPSMSGIQFSEIVKGKTNIIFATAYKQYGPEAFQVGALDYLLKPFTYSQFLNAVSKANQRNLKSDINREETVFFCINNEKSYKVTINANEIIQIKGLSNYFEILANSGKSYTYYGKLKDIIQQLRSMPFVRCHKSYIVNLKHAEVVAEKMIYMKNGSVVPIGDTYRSSLKGRIEAFLRI